LALSLTRATNSASFAGSYLISFPKNTEKVVKEWIAEKEFGMGAVMNVFRLLIVGESRGPHLFDIIAWIGKEETLLRLEKGLSIFQGET